MRLVRVLPEGTYDLLAVADGRGSCLFDELQAEENGEGVRADWAEEMFDWLEHVTNNGPGCNKARSEKFTNSDCFEFKAGRFRIGWFYDPRPTTRGRILLTHLFWKDTEATRPEDIRRAEDVRDRYIMDKTAKNIQITERLRKKNDQSAR